MARIKRSGVTLDDSVFRRKIKLLAKHLNVDEKQLVTEQGALHAIDMAKATPPFAVFPGGKSVGTKADLKVGRMGIAVDITNVCRSKDAGFIDFCAKTFGTGFVSKTMFKKGGGTYKIEYAAIGQSMAAVEKWHEERRQPSSGRTSYRQSINTMWVDEDLLSRYIAKRQENVGIAKAAFMGAAKRVNPASKTRSPAWVKRHILRFGGTGRVVVNRKGPTATYTASAAGLKLPISRRAQITTKRLKAMVKRMRFLLKKSKKQAGFK